ncbi:MAG: anti-sigma factor family protein [Bradymonadia bacterium]
MSTSKISCADFRQFIDPYLDGEFDERDRADFDAHAAGCPDCRQTLEQHIWFQRNIKRNLAEPQSMPPAARAKLRARLHIAQQPERRARWVKRLALPVPVLAAGAALLLITPLTGFTPVVDDVVEQHNQTMPVEVPSDQANEVDQWFKDKVPFAMHAPRFSDQRVTLLGGRLSQLRSPIDGEPMQKAAYLMYGVGREKLTVLVFEGKQLDLSKFGTQTRLKNLELSILDRGDYRVAMYRKDGLTYAVTSRLPESEMIRLVSTAL